MSVIALHAGCGAPTDEPRADVAVGTVAEDLLTPMCETPDGYSHAWLLDGSCTCPSTLDQTDKIICDYEVGVLGPDVTG